MGCEQADQEAVTVVASSSTLRGVAYANLSCAMKATIEAKIQEQLDAVSINATYSAEARRMRGRSLAPGDTVVEWEATFTNSSVASMVIAMNANVTAFEEGLATKLNAAAAFSGLNVTVSTSAFAAPTEAEPSLTNATAPPVSSNPTSNATASTDTAAPPNSSAAQPVADSHEQPSQEQSSLEQSSQESSQVPTAAGREQGDGFPERMESAAVKRHVLGVPLAVVLAVWF